MASKYSVKTYTLNGFYHVYNRGVEKRTIFQDHQDYSVFLSYLETYLSPKDEESLQKIIVSSNSSLKEKDKALKLLKLKNYHKYIELLSYALLPNHFHLLLKQVSPDCLNLFMNSIGTRYGMYFNRKYKRSGVLFQDVYKAVLVETEEQLLHLSRYINQNPALWSGLPINRWKESPFPCTIPEYLSERNTKWINTNYILNHFSKRNEYNSYSHFLEISKETDIIANLTIDQEID
ncbi:MAG: hypothetical protein UT63_C0001G0023 [Candidatus Gottesmanbacteria bacterium GW2011_GWC2_39_8]|uniref:Transposase IS200-like domain-containing protein n=1 Tax=Candidatus Gottesmanbacteria bacterium GW2011_GWC2_39_8 TaxID=1618450 RepID=A0A0G0QAU3_9BACT|nr:MAG: hypothetical protein UT63_C0001G0023 [Candidatus Gottesmanbacteria bacterium GW2011_GWC2_39_8]